MGRVYCVFFSYISLHRGRIGRTGGIDGKYRQDECARGIGGIGEIGRIGCR